MDNLIQIRFQVFAILLVLGPLLLGQNLLVHRQMHGPDQSEVTLVNDGLRQTTQGLLDVSVFIETIIPMEAILIESGKVIRPTA